MINALVDVRLFKHEATALSTKIQFEKRNNHEFNPTLPGLIEPRTGFNQSKCDFGLARKFKNHKYTHELLIVFYEINYAQPIEVGGL